MPGADADEDLPVVDGDGVGAPAVGERLTVGVVGDLRGGRAARVDRVQTRVEILVRRGDHPSQAGVGSQPVHLPLDVPLRHGIAVRRQLDDRAVEISVEAGLALRADTVLEPHEDVIAEQGDVVRVAQILGGGRVGARHEVGVTERRARKDLVRREHRGMGTGGHRRADRRKTPRQRQCEWHDRRGTYNLPTAGCLGSHSASF